MPGPDRGSGDLEFKRCSPCPLCRGGHGEPCQSKHKPGATGKSRAVTGIPAWGDFYQLQLCLVYSRYSVNACFPKEGINEHREIQ